LAAWGTARAADPAPGHSECGGRPAGSATGGLRGPRIRR
jgi:hypothetical protein